jgi:hypothetical protein
MTVGRETKENGDRFSLWKRRDKKVIFKSLHAVDKLWHVDYAARLERRTECLIVVRFASF